MADSNRFKLDSTVVKMVSDGKRQNYGHAIAKMFTDLGAIENDKVEQKQQDIINKTADLKYQSVSDTLADDKKYLDFVKSGETYDDWVSSGNSFVTSKYGDKAKAFGDTKTTLMNDKDIKYNTAQANRLFVKDGVFDEVGFYNHMDTQLTNKKINQDVYSDVIDGVNKNRKGGIYTAVKEEKTETISDKIKIDNNKKDKINDGKLETDLVDIRVNHKKLFGTDMTTAQELKYKKSGELPYMVYGKKNLKDARKKLIDSNIEVEKALTKLDAFSYKEIDSVVGAIQGSDIVLWSKKMTDKITPRQKKILTILGHINSDKMHELYGAALTGGEIGRATKWNLDTGQSAKSLMTAVNELRAKNTIQFESNTHGVHGIPMDNMTFGQFTIPSDDAATTKQNQKSTMSRADKIKFLQGN